MVMLVLLVVMLVMISIVLLLLLMVMITNFCDIERIVVRRLRWSICWRVPICSRK